LGDFVGLWAVVKNIASVSAGVGGKLPLENFDKEIVRYRRLVFGDVEFLLLLFGPPFDFGFLLFDVGLYFLSYFLP
jgi:hypothetical protein